MPGHTNPFDPLAIIWNLTYAVGGFMFILLDTGRCPLVLSEQPLQQSFVKLPPTLLRFLHLLSMLRVQIRTFFRFLFIIYVLFTLTCSSGLPVVVIQKLPEASLGFIANGMLGEVPMDTECIHQVYKLVDANTSQ